MWWFLWLLSYLIVGSLLMGWCLSISAKKGKFDPDNVSMPEIAASLVCVVLWPIMLCMLIFLGIAHAAKDQTQAKGTDQ